MSVQVWLVILFLFSIFCSVQCWNCTSPEYQLPDLKMKLEKEPKCSEDICEFQLPFYKNLTNRSCVYVDIMGSSVLKSYKAFNCATNGKCTIPIGDDPLNGIAGNTKFLIAFEMENGTLAFTSFSLLLRNYLLIPKNITSTSARFMINETWRVKDFYFEAQVHQIQIHHNNTRITVQQPQRGSSVNFEINLSDLTPNRSYMLRARARNESAWGLWFSATFKTVTEDQQILGYSEADASIFVANNKWQAVLDEELNYKAILDGDRGREFMRRNLDLAQTEQIGAVSNGSRVIVIWDLNNPHLSYSSYYLRLIWTNSSSSGFSTTNVASHKEIRLDENSLRSYHYIDYYPPPHQFSIGYSFVKSLADASAIQWLNISDHRGALSVWQIDTFNTTFLGVDQVGIKWSISGDYHYYETNDVDWIVELDTDPDPPFNKKTNLSLRECTQYTARIIANSAIKSRPISFNTTRPEFRVDNLTTSTFDTHITLQWTIPSNCSYPGAKAHISVQESQPHDAEERHQLSRTVDANLQKQEIRYLRRNTKYHVTIRFLWEGRSITRDITIKTDIYNLDGLELLPTIHLGRSNKLLTVNCTTRERIDQFELIMRDTNSAETKKISRESCMFTGVSCNFKVFLVAKVILDNRPLIASREFGLNLGSDLPCNLTEQRAHATFLSIGAAVIVLCTLIFLFVYWKFDRWQQKKAVDRVMLEVPPELVDIFRERPPNSRQVLIEGDTLSDTRM